MNTMTLSEGKIFRFKGKDLTVQGITIAFSDDPELRPTIIIRTNDDYVFNDDLVKVVNENLVDSLEYAI